MCCQYEKGLCVKNGEKPWNLAKNNFFLKNLKKEMTKNNYSDRINFADAGKELKKP